MTTRCLPAEWAPQGAAMLIWPHDGTDWAPPLEDAEAAFSAMAAAITRFEWLVLVCRDRSVRERALARLQAAGCDRAAIATVIADTDDTWTRDIAPLPVLEGERTLLVDFGFDGWGGRYPHARDARFGRCLIDSAGFAHVGFERAPLVLEGGAIDSDGAGTALVNAPALLDERRNPGLDAAGAEALLARHLGVERTLWLDVPPLPGDDTAGHIDVLARFCGTEVIAHTAPPRDGGDDGALASYSVLADQLAELRTAAGTPYRRVPLPAPAPVTDGTGETRVGSYANFLLVNGAILVPAFADPADAVAAERLHSLFPERELVLVPARTFLTQGGTLHCLVMSLPEGLLEDLAMS